MESLVIQPLEYLMTAKELGNQLESVKNNDTIAQYLTQATIMVVSVTASTTQGKNLTKEELDIVTSSCEMAIAMFVPLSRCCMHTINIWVSRQASGWHRC